PPTATPFPYTTLFRSQPLQRMGIRTPALALLLNRTEGISNDGRLITAGLRRSFAHTPPLLLLNTSIPGLVAYRQAATLGLPAHRFEDRKSTRLNSSHV